MNKTENNQYFPAGLIVSASVAIGGIAFYIFPLNNTPSCMFKELTGIPCPTCGGTRLYYSLLNLNIIKALYYNPLIFFSLIFLFFYSIHDILVILNLISPISINRVIFRYLILVLILLNWIYLIIMGI